MNNQRIRRKIKRKRLNGKNNGEIEIEAKQNKYKRQKTKQSNKSLQIK